MYITESKSKGELSVFTESFWVFPKLLSNQFILFPDGTFNVLICHDYFFINKKKYDKGIYLSPIINGPTHITSTGKIFGIRLKAFSLLNVLKCNGIELNRKEPVIPIELNQNLTDHFLNSTAKCYNLEDAQSTLEMLNYELICKRYSINKELRSKVNYILDRKGNVDINDLSEVFNISRQGLYKSFKKALGISPKELSTTWQLNHYLWLLNQDQSLTSSAYDAGYYDQAHSIKAFKATWGINPSTYAKANLPFIQYVNNTINRRFSNYYDPEL